MCNGYLLGRDVFLVVLVVVECLIFGGAEEGTDFASLSFFAVCVLATLGLFSFPAAACVVGVDEDVVDARLLAFSVDETAVFRVEAFFMEEGASLCALGVFKAISAVSSSTSAVICIRK